jgi:hypothetical protein
MLYLTLSGVDPGLGLFFSELLRRRRDRFSDRIEQSRIAFFLFGPPRHFTIIAKSRADGSMTAGKCEN